MTLLTTQSDISYAGLTGQDTFAYPFRVDQKTDMNVTLDNVAVAQGDFTMTGLGNNSGGNVVLNTPLVADATVLLFRVVPATQEVDYQPFDAFPAETHEGALDKLTMLVQQTASDTERALRFPVSDPASPILPDVAGRQNKFLAFDVNGEPIATVGSGSGVNQVGGTLPITSTGGLAPIIAINPATDSTSGSMSAADKAKLDGPLHVGKNYIINPNFVINQRNFAGGSGNNYLFDRWNTFDPGTPTISLPDANGVITLAGYTSSGAGSTVHNGFRQWIEANTFKTGQVLTLSWQGTAQAQIAERADALPAQAISPITYTVLDGTKDLNIIFGNGTLGEVKVEIGSQSTPYEPPEQATETLKAKRYYELFGAGGAGASSNALTNWSISYKFIEKRITPVISKQSDFKMLVTNIVDADITAINSFVATKTGSIITLQSGSTTTGTLPAIYSSPSDEIIADSEII